MAGLLSNFSAAEKALQEMSHAAGSSEEEMATIESSLSYKLNNLQQIWVGVAQTIVDRGDLGIAIDALSGVSEGIGGVIKQLGLAKTAILAITGILSAKNLVRYKVNSFTSIVKLLKMPRLFVSVGYDSFYTVLMGDT